MKYRTARVTRFTWFPTESDADARVYASDRGVMSATTERRVRVGRVSSDIMAGATYGTYRPGPTPAPGGPMVTGGHLASDGQGFVELASGRFLLMGGAVNGHGQTHRVNTIWYSDDRGRTWHVLLPDAAPSATRPAPGHTLGFFTATYSGVLYVYWLGGDPFAPSGDVFRIPAAALDVNGDPGTPWQLMNPGAPAPTAALVLFMYGVLPNGNIYVIGGQDAITDGNNRSQKVYVSTDQGATWSDTGHNCPATVWGAQLGPLPVKDGKFFICGTARYDDSDITDFSDAVYTYDGSAWALVKADGHGTFPRSRYHSLVYSNGRFWRFNGTVSNDVTLDSDTRSAHYSDNDCVTWQELTLPIDDLPALPWPETHAQAALATSDGIYVTSGFQNASLYVVREHIGTKVSLWEDQGDDDLHVEQTNANARPILAPSTMGVKPGIVFTKKEFLKLVGGAKDAMIADGFFEIFVIARSLSFDSTPRSGGPNPPCVFVGATDDSSWNNFGLMGPNGELQYNQASGGYQNHKRGSGFNDDRVHLFHVLHEAAAGGRVTFSVDGVQIGTVAPQVGEGDVAFDSTHTGWNAFGAGYNELDLPEMILGVAVIRKKGAPADATFKSNMLQLADRWGRVA